MTTLHAPQLRRGIRLGTFEHRAARDAFDHAGRAARAGHRVHLGKNANEPWTVTVEPRA
ncbi:hypothetical protein D3C81_1180720 [compost metagenome]